MVKFIALLALVSVLSCSEVPPPAVAKEPEPPLTAEQLEWVHGCVSAASANQYAHPERDIKHCVKTSRFLFSWYPR